MVDKRMRAIDEALGRLYPDWPTLPDEVLDGLAASADAAPEMTDRQRRRLGRILFAGRAKAS